MNAIAEFAYKLNCVLRHVKEDVIEVETPFSFAGDIPIRFRIETMGEKVKISDNSDAVYNLALAGVSTSDQQGWLEIRQIAGAFGIEFTGHGQMLGIDRISETQNLAIRFLSAMLAIAAYERKQLGETADSEKYQQSANRMMLRYTDTKIITGDPTAVS